MKEKRQHELEEYIHSLGVVTMEDLCQHFNRSLSTIRRDINRLVKLGVIQKVYGGVASLGDKIIPFERRDALNKPSKASIAKCAAEQLQENELIFIDSGTTTLDMINFLPQNIRLTVLTNSLDIINGISQFSNINLLVLGTLFKNDTRSFVGNDSLAILEKYNIDKAFMSATAISIENGLTNSDIQEYDIKKMVVQKAKQVFLLADASKFGHSTFLTYAQLNEIDSVITSNLLPERYLSYFADHHIEVCITAE